MVSHKKGHNLAFMSLSVHIPFIALRKHRIQIRCLNSLTRGPFLVCLFSFSKNLRDRNVFRNANDPWTQPVVRNIVFHVCSRVSFESFIKRDHHGRQNGRTESIYNKGIYIPSSPVLTIPRFLVSERYREIAGPLMSLIK